MVVAHDVWEKVALSQYSKPNKISSSSIFFPLLFKVWLKSLAMLGPAIYILWQ